MLGDAIGDRLPIIVFDSIKLLDNGALLPTNDSWQYFIRLFIPM